VERIVEALANHRPIAKIFRLAPDQADAPRSYAGNALGFAREEFFGSGGTCGVRNDDQELIGTARSEEELIQVQFGEKRARQHLGQQRRPLGAGEEAIVIGWGGDKLLDSQQFPL